MAPRSRTGCLTCRQRKLKCGEEKPTCNNCVKANRECIASQGITFRHQQNPSMNGGDRDSLKSFYGYKETFTKSTKWVNVPRDLTFIHTSNPYEDEEGDEIGSISLPAQTSFSDSHASHDFSVSAAPFSGYGTHGLDTLTAVASQDQYSFAGPEADMRHHERAVSLHSIVTSPQQTHPVTTPSQGLDFILNPTRASPVEPPSLDPALNVGMPHALPLPQHSPAHVRTQPFTSPGRRMSIHGKGLARRHAIEDPELAYLLRDCRNHPLCWMDLYDLDLFFAARVPVLAVDCPLLLYSCASLSAKSQARVHEKRPIMDGQISQSGRSKMEFWPGPPMGVEDWMRKGRECYDIAVSLLRQSLAGASRPPTSSLPEDATPATLLNAQSLPLPTTESDELVAATAILCVYEFLDASGPEWSRHLDGAKTLFDLAKDQAAMPLTLPPSPVSLAHHVTHQLAGSTSSLDAELQDRRSAFKGLSPGRKAVFWCFARQDMLSAFINNTQTRLDTADLLMWRGAGLKLTPDGFVMPSNPQHPNYVAEQAMGDDMIGNALVWLVMKLVNFIAAGDELPDSISPLGLGVRQAELLEYWEGLDEQLRVWHDGLPDSYQPTAVQICSPECETEMWFPRPMCASTMQWYNFARIQLLHNKPHVSTARPGHMLGGGLGGPVGAGASLASKSASYAAILQQSRVHAKEIVAISNGRADEGTRVHSVQPLWTAGLVLGHEPPEHEVKSVGPNSTTSWRKTIVGLLRGIEKDMGWAAEYRVQSLLEIWGPEARVEVDWAVDKEV